MKGKKDLSKEEKMLIQENKIDFEAYEELKEGFKRREINNEGFITRLDLIEIFIGSFSLFPEVFDLRFG